MGSDWDTPRRVEEDLGGANKSGNGKSGGELEV